MGNSISIQFRSVCLSAHLDSFCQKLDELTGGRFEFIYLSYPGEMRRRVGWSVDASYKNSHDDDSARKRALECDLLIIMEREFDLVKTRLSAKKTTIYISERWLKPIRLRLFGGLYMVLPGILRVFSPKHVKLIRQIASFMECESFYVLPIGVHAVRDMVRLYRLANGDFRCLFRAPEVEIDRKLGGRVNGFPRIKLWGYFVEPSKLTPTRRRLQEGQILKILWCGRLIALKKADVLVRAFRNICGKRAVSLLIVGEGPEESRLKALVGDKSVDGLLWENGKVSFCGYVSSWKIRELMHEADLYVMTSNAEEGWGAVVPEALVEGCPVISTYEAGSSATLLPTTNLYHAKSVGELSRKIMSFFNEGFRVDCSGWSGSRAAEILMEIVSTKQSPLAENSNGEAE